MQPGDAARSGGKKAQFGLRMLLPLLPAIGLLAWGYVGLRQARAPITPLWSFTYGSSIYAHSCREHTIWEKEFSTGATTVAITPISAELARTIGHRVLSAYYVFRDDGGGRYIAIAPQLVALTLPDG